MTRRELAGYRTSGVPVGPGTLFVLAALVLSLGGCGGNPPPGRAKPVGAPSPGAPAAILVEFERHGGFAGFSDRLTIRADGTFTVVRSRPAVTRAGRLNAGELADLRARLADAHLAGLPTRQPGSGSDLFTYQVSAGGVRIVAQDGGVVEPLRPLIAVLVALVDGSTPST